MIVPPGHTEETVLEAIERSVKMLAHQFTFGYFEAEDIAQQIRVYALEALPRYDPRPDDDGVPTRPLENFIFTHSKNRLINLYRDKCRRNDPPCLLCHQGRQAEHADGEVCAKYRSWRRRNNAKANLVRPQGIDTVTDEREPAMRTAGRAAEEADLRDDLAAVDAALPLALRADYLRMRADEYVPKARRQKVEAAVLAILEARGRGEG